jgi:ribosomal protein S18 acetylase RimI-like enzyme
MNPDEKLLPSPDLIDRVVAVANAYAVSRIKVLQSLPGNPVGIEVRELGDNAIALMAKHFPNPNFNRVAGLKRDHLGEIEPLLRWYRDNRVAPRFEILPREGDGELGRELSRLGLYPSAFHTTLVRDVVAPPDTGHVTLEQVSDAATMDAFLDAYIAGWKIPDGPGFKRNVSAGWLDRPGWSLFLARVDGKPAAEGILYVKDGVGYLADASCDPAYRRRGLQAALLARRIAEARRADADMVCSGAAYLSTSHRNMERAGLRILFNSAIWTELSAA